MFRREIPVGVKMYWYKYYEFIVEITYIGIEYILEFVKKVNGRHWENKSSKNILKYFNNVVNDIIGHIWK